MNYSPSVRVKFVSTVNPNSENSPRYEQSHLSRQRLPKDKRRSTHPHCQLSAFVQYLLRDLLGQITEVLAVTHGKLPMKAISNLGQYMQTSEVLTRPKMESSSVSNIESLIVLIDNAYDFTISKEVTENCWPLFEWQRKLKLVQREKGRVKIKNVEAQVFTKFLNFAIDCAARLRAGYLNTISLIAGDAVFLKLLGKGYFDDDRLDLHVAEQMLDKFLRATELPNYSQSTIVENCKVYDFVTTYQIYLLRVLAFLNIKVQICNSAARLKSSHVRSEKMYSTYTDDVEYSMEACRARELTRELQEELSTVGGSTEQQTQNPIHRLMLSFEAFYDKL